jgi:membrane-anchored mycosin MYCP
VKRGTIRAGGLLAALLATLLVPAPAAFADPAAPVCDNQFESTQVKTTPWQQKRLDLEAAWKFSTGSGSTVAVLDTGVDLRNPQLRPPPDGSFRVVEGHKFVTTDAVPASRDCDGHGTFVAGIIAAQREPGVAFVGVAPRAKIMSVRFTEGVEKASVKTLATAIRWAADHGANVINVSSVTHGDNTMLRQAVEYAQNVHDALIVAAAGNEGQAANAISYPAAYPGVIAVGAVDEKGGLAGFSTTSFQISLTAPGADVVSTAPIGGHKTESGTSFAAPFVSGVAALVRTKYPTLTAAQVKRRLEVTADHPGGNLPDPKLGWGVVNPYEALTAIVPDEGALPTRTAAAPISPIQPPAQPDQRPIRIALIVFGSAAAFALLALVGVTTYRRGQKRRWQPGMAPTQVDDL